MQVTYACRPLQIFQIKKVKNFQIHIKQIWILPDLPNSPIHTHSQQPSHLDRTEKSLDLD